VIWEYPSYFDRNCAITLFFWDINLDFRDSQRRENEPLLDESGNWVSHKNPTYGPQIPYYFWNFGPFFINCPIYVKNTNKGYISS
jgi:hypothetical protein